MVFRGGNPSLILKPLAHLRGPYDDTVAVQGAPSAALLLLPLQAHCHWAQFLIYPEEVLVFWGRQRAGCQPQ